MDVVLYLHGRGGSAAEAAHYRALFPSCEVVGLDYGSELPWEAGRAIREAVRALRSRADRVILIANSIGAFFALHADVGEDVARAFFLSPVVDLERLIAERMARAGVSEAELREKGTIPTDSGEELSWAYLCFVRDHPVRWDVPTDILYGSEDSLIPFDAVAAFAGTHHASLTVCRGGEHWFHTEEQMRFLDNWIRERTSTGGDTSSCGKES